MSWNIFKRKPKEPIKIKIGKADVFIVTKDGGTYLKPIFGHYEYLVDDYYIQNVRNFYMNFYAGTQYKFIGITDTFHIPICNVTNMSLINIDDDYEVEVTL